MHRDSPAYVGFWPRLGAMLVDGLWIGALLWALAYIILAPTNLGPTALYQAPSGIALSALLPSAVMVGFWRLRQATPGKMLVNARIVDHATGRPASLRQYVIRYLAYLPSAIPLFLGCIWVAFNNRRRGWHDLIAGTAVIHPEGSTQRESRFFDSDPASPPWSR